MTSGQSTGSTTQIFVRGRSQSGDHAEDRRALRRAVVEDGKWKLEPVIVLSDGEDLFAHLAENPPRTRGERLTAERCERLRRAEAFGRAADQEDSRRG